MRNFKIKDLKEDITDYWFNFLNFFQRKPKQIKRLIKWFPLIWNLYDFDYIYALDVFKFQLEALRDNIKKNGFMENSKITAERIDLILRLMDRAYYNTYSEIYWQSNQISEILKPYEHLLGFETESIKNGSLYELKFKYEKECSKEEIEIIQKEKIRVIKELENKELKAKELMWKLLAKDFDKFWD